MDEATRNVTRVCGNLDVAHFKSAVNAAKMGNLNLETVQDLHATFADAEEWTRTWLERHARA